MKRNTLTALLIAAFVVVLGGALLLYRGLAGSAQPGLVAEQPTAAPGAPPLPENIAAPEETEPPRTEAPDFTVYDGEGNAVQLSGFEGKPVILNFWASWCGPCQSEMPDFQDAFDRYGEDIHFVMVNSTDGMRETVDTAAGFLEDSGYTFPAYYDTDFDASATYGVSGLPTTFFIDSEGYLVAYASGALNAEILQQGIDMILPAA